MKALSSFSVSKFETGFAVVARMQGEGDETKVVVLVDGDCTVGRRCKLGMHSRL